MTFREMISAWFEPVSADILAALEARLAAAEEEVGMLKQKMGMAPPPPPPPAA